MSKSPGHRKWPEHKVEEKALGDRLHVEAKGRVIAESGDVVKVEEDEQPDRYYVLRSDVDMNALEPSGKTTECPFKGTARYFNIKADGETLQDAAWSYEAPYDEHRALKGRVAFHDERGGIDLRTGA